MGAYILRRLFLIVPTLLGIMIINFLIIQAVPGGPVEQILAELQGVAQDTTARISGGGSEVSGGGSAAPTGDSKYRGAEGLDPAFVKDLEKRFGFDKPLHERFMLMIGSYLRFDFGDSFFRDQSVIDLVAQKMPVSISLGLWTTLFTYLISIPLGIAKAVRDGSRFDVYSSGLVIIGNAIPSFLFALLLIILFAGGRYWDVFPLRGLTSSDFETLSTWGQIKDYLWHITLPVAAMTIGGFAGLTMLTKNSFLDQIHQQYVITARAKGLTEQRVLYGHVFRNSMLIVIAGFPSAFVSILFSSALLIEIIFSLDGLGLLGWDAIQKRDYPVIFGTLYFFTLLGLLMNLIGDMMYHVIDPRIDFEKREA
ncbi:microcin C ABC transporter permease YejB [Magnetospira sp. QH-2]|uniref:microcin C ABC transporter permease YejB n=1 Tax=Magnetospira sp. (strain QH-2) TaxID=1288970 RepID=UPI0003E813D7|nr:microcin C ABC transporter permease YejB [Magnetospira sp. QH-2]CCQ72101.1 ABC transporter, membrane subunit [Magnetospira sp. QH-2]